ncbi:hypothetical protein [Streptomyces sp. NPDC000878]
MREIHAGSTPDGADQHGSHQPRPPITIQQHACWAAMAGGMVGPNHAPAASDA